MNTPIDSPPASDTAAKPPRELNVEQQHTVSGWPLGVKVKRLLWGPFKLLFLRGTGRWLSPVRVAALRLFGAQIETPALIMDGEHPARVPDQVIAGIRAREVRGAVELPKSSGLKPGDHVKILGGPFRGQLAFYAGMKPHQRVEVLLALLGSQQRVILPRADVEALAAG